MIKDRHDGDCSIYSSVINGRPEDGICCCGYGIQVRRHLGDDSQMYSAERLESLRTDSVDGEELIDLHDINELQRLLGDPFQAAR
jgi:hypothetical protein